MIRALVTAATTAIKSPVAIFESLSSPPLIPHLAQGLTATASEFQIPSTATTSVGPSLFDCLWLAVPKRKVTPGKRRMKTTIQKRIKKKDHIIVDERTGEITLKHRLPFNWKDYLPENMQ